MLVTSSREINVGDFEDKTDTLVKLQVWYADKNARAEDAQWDAELGYNYVYLFDLEKGSYEMTYVKCPY